MVFGLALARLWKERVRTFKLIGAGLLALTVAALVWHVRPTPAKDSLIVPNSELAAYVTANSASQDTIFVWGLDPDLYLRSDRDPAGPLLLLPTTDDARVQRSGRRDDAQLVADAPAQARHSGKFGDLTTERAGAARGFRRCGKPTIAGLQRGPRAGAQLHSAALRTGCVASGWRRLALPAVAL